MKMDRSFTLRDSVVLQFQELDLDVHNTYVLDAIEEGRSDCDVLLTLKKDPGVWVPSNYPVSFAVCFRGVSYLEHSYPILGEVPAEIDEVGFKNPDDKDYDWLLTEEQSDANDHLVFRFVNDEILRIFADIVELRLDIPDVSAFTNADT